MKTWSFSDAQNVAVITTAKVCTKEDWIAHVYHDKDDGTWQFLGTLPGEITEKEALIVALGQIVEIDLTVSELADLPLGWHAWRDVVGAAWKRSRSA